MTELLNRVISAVREAGEILSQPFTVEEKQGISNLVTTADHAVEHFLRERLLQILPEAGFLGEEGDRINLTGKYFVVDPVDGTSNFARGIPLSVISVGLMEAGKPTLGVVHNPLTGELYCAQAGQGAYLNGKPIHVSSRDFSHGLFYTAFSLYRKEYAAPCMRILEQVYMQCDDFRREGSAALELCRIAAGRAELYFEMRVFPWDVCAAEAIISEAGGCFTHLLCEKEDPTRPHLMVAANSNENLCKLTEFVLREIPALPDGYYRD